MVFKKQAGFIISDNMDAASDKRIELFGKLINKIAAANKVKPMFSHICVYFHLIETETRGEDYSPIFKMAKEAGLGIIADTLNTNYRQGSRQEYVDHILRMMNDVHNPVDTVRIDDASTLSDERLKEIVVPIRGLRWVLSSSVKGVERLTQFAAKSEADVKVSMQGYLNGANIAYLQNWLKEKAIYALDFEAYREDRMTSPQEILNMGTTLLASQYRDNPLFVYGHDQNTNWTLRTLDKQWQALQTVLSKYHDS